MSKLGFKVKKQRLPRMQGGGSFDFTSLFTGAADAVGAMKKPDNQEYLNSDAGKYLAESNSKMAALENGQKAVEKAVAMIPVWGQIAAGASAAGRAIGKHTKDEFGIYKSDGAQILDRVVNPMSNFGPSQDKLERMKDVFRFDQNQEAVNKHQVAGAQLRSSIPTFQAPAYGKEGMKLTRKTKFSSGGVITDPNKPSSTVPMASITTSVAKKPFLEQEPTVTYDSMKDLRKLFDKRTFDQKSLDLESRFPSMENEFLPSDFPSIQQYDQWYTKKYGQSQFNVSTK